MKYLFEKNFRKLFFYYSKSYGYLASKLFGFISLPPSKITFKITNICNVDCHFCYNANKNIQAERREEISLDSWKKVVDQVPFSSVISFTGGEVFLYPKIFELIKYIGLKKKKCSIVTNASTLQAADIDLLISSQVYYLMISIHGLEQTHNRIFGGTKNYFQQSLDTIKLINKMKKDKKSNYPKIGVKVVITQDNLNEIIQLLNLCENELSVSNVYFNFLTNEPFEIYDDIEKSFLRLKPRFEYSEFSKGKIIKLLDDIEEYRKTSQMDIGFTSEFANLRQRKEFIDNPYQFHVSQCFRPLHEIYIQPNGDVILCLRYKIGNINDVGFDLKKIHLNSKYSNLINEFKLKKYNTDFCLSCQEAPFEKIK